DILPRMMLKGLLSRFLICGNYARLLPLNLTKSCIFRVNDHPKRLTVIGKQVVIPYNDISLNDISVILVTDQ
ncbi:MAG: hypothetical protein ACNA8H_15305, partial [Anaerolineales bacterium]